MGDDDEAVDVDVDGAARAVRSLRVRTGEVGAGSGGDRSRAVMAMGRVRGGMTRRMTVTESIALCATPHRRCWRTERFETAGRGWTRRR